MQAHFELFSEEVTKGFADEDEGGQYREQGFEDTNNIFGSDCAKDEICLFTGENFHPGLTEGEGGIGIVSSVEDDILGYLLKPSGPLCRGEGLADTILREFPPLDVTDGLVRGATLPGAGELQYRGCQG